MVITMKIISPIVAILALATTTSQEPEVNMIVKDFVTIGLIMNIDEMLAEYVP